MQLLQPTLCWQPWEMSLGLNIKSNWILNTEYWISNQTKCKWITMPECPCQYSQLKCSQVHSLLGTLRNVAGSEYQTKVKAVLETWCQLLYQTVSYIFSSQNERESQKLWKCLRFDRFLVAGEVTPETDRVETALPCQQTAHIDPGCLLLSLIFAPHSTLSASPQDHH